MEEWLKISGWGGKSNWALTLVLFILLVIITSSQYLYRMEEDEGQAGILAIYSFNLYNDSSFYIRYNTDSNGTPSTFLSPPPSPVAPKSSAALKMVGPDRTNIGIDVSYIVLSDSGIWGNATFRISILASSSAYSVSKVSNFGIINVLDSNSNTIRIIKS
ncbi:hypothetical protein M3223_07600 [Paenibacillus pasadenensis]|uniref:hypothetical protein n=1 Tax=Paenibacillus pasadenensis TaxID=217090 RepID=UPI00203CD226|nr:hypothetical protein [Paenibacillus pasadenensis]MCM3747218.1 hypothetical protein [Paenibacillus pasadenensis]